MVVHQDGCRGRNRSSLPNLDPTHQKESNDHYRQTEENERKDTRVRAVPFTLHVMSMIWADESSVIKKPVDKQDHRLKMSNRSKGFLRRMKLNSVLYRRCLVTAVSTFLALSVIAQGTGGGQTNLLTFDDLEPGLDYAAITNGYGGLQWNNFQVLNGSLRPATEGYRAGVVSPPNVAFNGGGDPASIRGRSPFDLKSAYLTAAHFDGVQIGVHGWAGTTLAYSNAYTLNKTGPTLIHFNYVGVTEVRFTPSVHSQWFVVDNLTAVVRPSPPLPVVSIKATVPETVEPSPNTDVRPGEFTITRTGDTSEALTLYVQFGGTARPGEDYNSILHMPGGTNSSPFLQMAAGETTLRFEVMPRDDLIVEGAETVVATLREPPIDSSLLNYRIDPEQSEARVIIHDNDRADGRPVVGLELVNRYAGETLPYQNAIFWGEFRVLRTGSLSNELVVFLATEGSARLGEDYRFAPANDLTVRFPPGRSSVDVRLYPIDDELVEGEESAIVRLVPPPYAGPLPDPYEINHERASVEILIRDNDPILPLVSIRTPHIPERTAEPCPVCLVAPGVIIISRTYSTTQPLTVYLEAGGTAIPGLDYATLPHSVTIPAGTNSAHLLVLPHDDLLVEGPEVVRASIARPPELATLGYVVNVEHSEAFVVINDDEPGAPDARLDIIEPSNNAQFAPGTTVELSALSVVVNGEVFRPVEFYAGDRLIGRSAPGPARPPIPSLPNVHTIHWTNPPSGSHVLTARTELSLDRWLVSPPVHIAVGAEPPRTIVGIEATQPVAEESSFPLRRLPLRGEFTIFRAGPTNHSLLVFLHVSGTATPGIDYPYLPLLVTIPAGATSTQVEVVPIDDNVPEGVETVVAKVSDCPPNTDPPLGMPCYGGFEVDPTRDRATVFIRDNAVTRASLTITEPKNGDAFDVGDTILIEATAIDLEGYISRVEFWDGERMIGVSEIVFIREPDPGTPIHHSFEWRGATAGRHVLTARAESNGERLISSPVAIAVGSNQPPRIGITQPAGGTEFPLETPIEIVVETADPDGYVPRVEFFADGRKIGEANVVFVRPPDPGQTQTFTFVWRQPTPGRHVLTAVATDDGGSRAISAPVEIKVATSEPLPIVTVTSPDSCAVEPRTNSLVNTATFRIRRHGPTNDALVVAYSLRGTAENGVDYETLSGLATIPAGQRSAPVIVRPLPDNLRDGSETVRLSLEEPPPSGTNNRVINPYRVGRPRTAVAVISDYLWLTSANTVRCMPTSDGCAHLCFAAETGQNFRIEATTDCRNWETLFDTVGSDGALHFIDTETQNHSHRFYRIAPEPVPEPNE